jgi:hypothetical protein
MSTDSPRNCHIRDCFNAPETFLMPTSFALFSLLAVDRFMKLMQAINKRKPAMIERMRTISILPPFGFPSLKEE